MPTRGKKMAGGANVTSKKDIPIKKADKAKVTGGYKGGSSATRKKKIAADIAAAKKKGTKKKPFDAKKAKAKVDAL